MSLQKYNVLQITGLCQRYEKNHRRLFGKTRHRGGESGTGFSCQPLWVSIQIIAAPIIFCSLYAIVSYVPGAPPGIPDKNAYHFQGEGTIGGSRGFGMPGIIRQMNPTHAFPAAAAAFLIFLMLLMVFIMCSFLAVHDRPEASGLGNKKGNVPSPYAAPEFQPAI